MQCQLRDKAANPFCFYGVENDQAKNGDGHAKRDIDVSGRHHLQIGHTDHHANLGQPVDRYEIHQVHEEDPDKDCQGEWCYQRALAVKGILDARVDEIDDDLDECLHLARLVRRGLCRRASEYPSEDEPEQHRKEHRVDVDRHRVASAVIPYPLTVNAAYLQVLQMVCNVITGRTRAVSAFTRHLFFSYPLSLPDPASGSLKMLLTVLR